jgi:hypothetical protein
MSELPRNFVGHPHVASVRPERESDYYYEVMDRAFTCPALHATVRFSNSGPSYVPRNIEDRSALAAYADLVTHAEDALPTGKFSTFGVAGFGSDPTLSSLWSSVILGGEYRIGPNEKLTKVLVTLKGSEFGYRVSRAWVASADEYADYEANIDLWQNALRDYFDFFVKS